MDIPIVLFVTVLNSALNSALEGRTAYLDPGSGSFILQLIIASLLGGLFIIKGYWQKIRTFVRGLFNKRGGDQQE